MSGLSMNKSLKIAKILGAFVVNTSNLVKQCEGRNATISVLSGNLWINPNAVAVADATALKLVAGNAIDLTADTVNMISDASTATVQMILWEQ